MHCRPRKQLGKHVVAVYLRQLKAIDLSDSYRYLSAQRESKPPMCTTINLFLLIVIE
ncbi:hypothetical protein D3C76_1711970 [compost metagenome]